MSLRQIQKLEKQKQELGQVDVELLEQEIKATGTKKPTFSAF